MNHTNLGEGIKILIPFDGSESSVRALDEAIYLTRKFNGNLTLLHVIQKDERRGRIFHWHNALHDDSFSITEGTEIRDRASLQIFEDNEMKLEQSGIKYTLRSETAESISKTVNEIINGENYSLIILGSRDPINHQIPKRIISESNIPILLVR